MSKLVSKEVSKNLCHSERSEESPCNVSKLVSKEVSKNVFATNDFTSPLAGEGVRRTGEGFENKVTKLLGQEGTKNLRHSERSEESHNKVSELVSKEVRKNVIATNDFTSPLAGEVCFQVELERNLENRERGKIDKLDCFAFARNDRNLLLTYLPTNLLTCKRVAFTLAEVLITLGIIGVVAAMTITGLQTKWKELEYKIAYRKAYSDLCNIFSDGLFEQEFTRTELFNSQSTIEEFSYLKHKFKVIKECNEGPFDCWADADRVCTGACMPTGTGVPTSRSKSFIDASGRSWATYSSQENIYLVDTNGNKLPNQFGKDRWLFTFADINGVRTNVGADYRKIRPFINSDYVSETSFCTYPPCNYYSWLFEN